MVNASLQTIKKQYREKIFQLSLETQYNKKSSIEKLEHSLYTVLTAPSCL